MPPGHEGSRNTESPKTNMLPCTSGKVDGAQFVELQQARLDVLPLITIMHAYESTQGEQLLVPVVYAALYAAAAFPQIRATD